MKIDDILLTECATSVLYHYAGITSARDILRDGVFKLSSTTGNPSEAGYAPPGYQYFLSTTRSRVGDYHRYVGSGAAMFVLDGDWFSQRYPVKPVDYWERAWQHSPDRTRESEDRVFSKDNEISIGGVRALHVLMKEQSEVRSPATREMLIMARKRGIPSYLYMDEKAWRLQDTRRAVTVAQAAAVLRGPKPSPRSYRSRNFLEEILEMIFKKNKAELTAGARKRVQNLLIYGSRHPTEDDGLGVDMSNARKPGSSDYDSAVKINQFMRANGLKNTVELKNHLVQKWEATDFFKESLDEGQENTAMMGKLSDSGKIIRILRKQHSVPFSNDKDWLLVDVDPALGNRGLGIKWIPASTKFTWVRPYLENPEIAEAAIDIGQADRRAQAWIDRVYDLYPATWGNNHVMTWGEGDQQQLAFFELIPSMSKKHAVEVKWFQAYPMRQGVGSRAMQQLQTLAREDGIALTLYPWDKGRVSQAKLTKFYKGQGFKPTVKGAKNMMWTPEGVTEAFDQPYPMKWEKSEADDSMDALVKLPDGSNLSIMFNMDYDEEGEEVVQVEFWRNNSQEVTGEGDAQRVFATVLSAIQQYIKTHKTKRLSFSASKEVEPGQNSQSRANLYDKLVQRYARSWGYRAFRADTGTIVRYELSRLKQGVAEGSEHEGLVLQFLKSITPKELRYYSIRDNCGPAALHMMDWAKEKGIELHRVNGYFVADNVVYDKADFTKEMKHEFLQQGLDFNDPKSRQEFIASNPKYSKEWKKVPHYWLQDDRGTVYDPTGYIQFIKTGLAKDLDKSRYETVQGVAEGLSESRNSLFAFVKQQFPTWPDYVLKDFLYQQAKGIRDQAELDDFLKRNKQDFGNCKWTLTKLPITVDIFTPKTQRMLASREGGSSNPFQVPRDAERHAQQSQMIQQKGVSAEPIIVAKLSNGYDLIEGWHRTIQHLKAFPQGYTGPAWVCTGATYKSESVEQGVAEGLEVDVPNEDWLQDKIDYAKSKGRNRFGVPYMGSTTASVRGTPPRVRVMRLASLPGMRNEQMNVRKDDLKWLMDYMERTGKLPPKSSDPNDEYLPFIMVAYNGEAWVNEGNHRIMAAYRLNWPDMPVEIRYFDGGERVASGPMAPGKIGLGPVKEERVLENFADGKGPGRAGDSQRHGIRKGATMAELEKASHAKGRKGQLARWQLNMRRGQKKHNEGIMEGGWASVATQDTVITPAIIEEALVNLNEFAGEYNVWQAQHELGLEIKIGKPKGSGTYYTRDLVQDPAREYGDIDIECFIHSKEGTSSAQLIAQYKNAITEFTKHNPEFSSDNGTNIIMNTSAGPAQVDLIYTFNEHANWSRALSPEYRVKGVISTSLTSALAEALNLSFGSQGIQVKTRAGRPVSFRQSRDTELKTITTTPESWARDIFQYYYTLANGQPYNDRLLDLDSHPGLKDEQRLSDIVHSIRSLAAELERNNLLGTGALDYIGNANNLLTNVAKIYANKLETVINSSKFDKAETPAAEEKAKKTKLMLAKYRNEITKLLLN